MKILGIGHKRKHQLLLDDEDFARLECREWKVYWQNMKPVIKVWFRELKKELSLLALFVPDNASYFRVHHKDGNLFNWQKENLLIAWKTGCVDVKTPIEEMKILATWCPHDPQTVLREAKIAKDGSLRPEECSACPDHFGGPYWRCLNELRRTFWRGWKRDGRKPTENHSKRKVRRVFKDSLGEESRVRSQSGCPGEF